MKAWIEILLQVLVGVLVQEGKQLQADVINDALKVARAGGNVDAEMQRVADEWLANGEPSQESIIAARKAIQAAIGD